jgi:integrase
MSLYRVGATWYIDLPSQRGRVRRSARTTDRAKAQAYHDKIQDQLWRQEQLGEKPPPTWIEAVAAWLKKKPRGMPEKYMIKAFEIEEGEPLPLSEDAMLDAIGEGSDGTFNRKLNLLYAIHRSVKIEPVKVDRKASPPGKLRWLTKEEWGRLRKKLENTSPLLVDCADFTLATGLRENNVLNLEWRQILWGPRLMVTEASNVKNRQTLGTPLNDDAMAVLRRRRGLNKVYVFAQQDSQKPLYKASNRAWYQALKAAKLYKTGVNWHTLRHTWASWFLMSGAGDLYDLQRLGGWKDIKSVQIYAHLSAGHLAEKAAKVRPISGRYNSRKSASRDIITT